MATIMNVNHFSIYLKHNMDCTVILPSDIEVDKKLPILWLYHGGSGDHTSWLYHSPICEYVDDGGFAAVLPNVHNSCFVDMNIGDRYATYVGKELFSIITNMFPCLSKERENNLVCGLSNGGYGCLHIALKYPEKYGYVGAFSAGDKADADFPNDGGAKSLTRIQLYGDGDLHNTEYSLIYQAEKLIKEEGIKPRIYHACGSLDPWLDMNHIVRDYFISHKEYDYTYDEIEQIGHEWKFWREELRRFLVYAGILTDDYMND